MIRWKCEDCDKIWIYPIKRCFYCKKDVKRVTINPDKIIAVSKVTVPSPMHPTVPYYVLLLEDKDGNRIPRKSMKEYRVGDIFVDKKAETKDAVTIVRTKYDMYDAVKNLIEISGVEIKDRRYLIKPNIEVPAYPYQASCTNPLVVDAIIKNLIDNGVKKENIIVGEQSVVDSIKSAAKAGILSVCKNNGVKFIDLGGDEFVEKEIEGQKFMISKEVLDRTIINVPVLKSSTVTGLSGALENMTRVVDHETQKMMTQDPDTKIAQLNKLLKYYTIGDATLSMQGDGPYPSGEPAYLYALFGSRDPVALDAVFTEAGMFDLPEHVKIASDLGVGNSNIKDIEIAGYELDALKLELKKPSNKNPNPKINVINGRPTQKEYFSLYSLLSKFNNISINKTNIVIGQNFDEDIKLYERIIAYGDQAIERLKGLGITPMAEIKGCPPDGVGAYILLKKLLTSEGEVSLTMFDRAKSKVMSKINKIGG